MKKITPVLIIISLSLMIACSPPKNNEPIQPPTSADFSKYAQVFQSHLTTAGSPYNISGTSITFSDTLANNILGVCYMGTGVIRINRYLWENYLTESGKEQLIFHEMGHCTINRDHDTSLDGSSNPLSIMYPTHIHSSRYISYYQSYLTELFGGTITSFAGLSFNNNYYTSMASTIETDFSLATPDMEIDDSQAEGCLHYGNPHFTGEFNE